MATISRRAILGAGLGISSMSVLAACGKSGSTTSTSTPSEGSSAGTATASAVAPASSTGSVPADQAASISVAAYAPGSDKATIDAFNKQLATFKAAHPQLDVKGLEWTWDASTFAAQLAGDKLPNEFGVPFTDGKTLIANKQVYDASELLAATSWAKKLNPNVAQAGQDAQGKLVIAPYMAYGIGLTYNRQMFEDAGLDPDKPPATWDEVREAAKKIAQDSGQAGYAQMTSKNCGGWMLASLAYTLGGRLETDDGKTALVNSPEVVKALQLLQKMRWEDNSMGTNMLYDWGSINQDFCAGKIGMFMGGSDLFGPMTQQNQLDPTIYGLTVLPQEGDKAGFLAGGALAAISKNSTDAQAKAVLTWIEDELLAPMVDEQAAKTRAKADNDAKQPVGIPGMPVFDRATWEQQQTWIKEYVNVPLAQFQPYVSKIFDLKLVSEPARKTQEVYAALDPLVQAVLTKKGSDVNALVKQYQPKVQQILDKK